VLAAETLRASDIVIYLSQGSDRSEQAIKHALRERVQAGLPELPIRLQRTAHRYVAGESSAVVNRASGGVSKPKFSLQRTAEKGIDDRPTLIQNTETMAHVAMIARYGSDWFRKLGTEQSPGSTLMTLCGNVRHPGVYEVNLGATLGGVLGAVGGTTSPAGGALLGGYFGSWLPPAFLDELPLDVDRLRSDHGVLMGCGVLAILPQGGCGIAECSRILTYLAAESAGQCGPCVNGLAALAGSMDRIANSKPEPKDLENVNRWIGMVRGRGACNHPDGAVGQLSSALKAFEADLTTHLSGRRCRGVDLRGFPRPPVPGDRWR
jgi:NADH:ubiquinone oxidoreductase subunit F (NADH-binding)